MPAWLVLLALGIGAVVGYSYGLIAAVLALVGLVLGGVIGFHIASAISLGSPGWALLGALLGAVAGAGLLGRVGHHARAGGRIPLLGLADGVLGAALGAGVAVLVLAILSPSLGRLGAGPRLPFPGRDTPPAILTRIERALGGGLTPGEDPRLGPPDKPRGP